MPTIPKGAKVPADRKLKVQDSPPSAPTHLVVAAAGEVFEVPVDLFDDVEFVELTMGFEAQPTPTHMLAMVRHMLGDDWPRFKDAARVDGRVSFAALGEFFTAAQAAIEALGNSGGSAAS